MEEPRCSREESLTCGLSRALILKKMVSAERFLLPGMEEGAHCPRDCHACCAEGVALDLTAVEALVVYLLNREMIRLASEYRDLHGRDGFCPFLVQERCVINTYKPSACQMYMPFSYQGGPMCGYLAEQEHLEVQGDLSENYLNSACYGIHGCMLLIQCSLDDYLERTFFRHVWEGVCWWEEHYHALPAETRRCLESILEDGRIGTLLAGDVPFAESLRIGQDKYLEMLAR